MTTTGTITPEELSTKVLFLCQLLSGTINHVRQCQQNKIKRQVSGVVLTNKSRRHVDHTFFPEKNILYYFIASKNITKSFNVM